MFIIWPKACSCSQILIFTCGASLAMNQTTKKSNTAGTLIVTCELQQVQMCNTLCVRIPPTHEENTDRDTVEAG